MQQKREKGLIGSLLGAGVGDVGEGKFQEDSFEEVKEESSGEEGFGFEEEDEGCGKVDVDPFRKSITLGPQNKPQIDNDQPHLYISGYSFLFGHNPGRHTVTTVINKPCFAVGTNLFFQGKIYFGHNYDITYLHYDQKREVLISGTQGKCAQIKLWKRGEKDGKVVFVYEGKGKKKYNLPMNSLGVAFAWLTEDNLMVCTRYSLHRSSQIFLFNLQTGKRTHCFCKLGRTLSVIDGEPVTILTDKGIWQFSIDSATQYKLNQILQIQATIFDKMEGQNVFIVGCVDGRVQLTHKDKCVQDIQSHQQSVVSLKVMDNGRMVSGGNDFKLVLHKVEAESIQIIHKIQLPSVSYNLLVSGDELLCVLRNTQMLKLNLEQNTIKIEQDQLGQGMVFSHYPQTQKSANFVYNKYNQKYYYSLSDTSELSTLSFQEGSIKTSKKITLRHQPHLLDVRGNTATYVHKILGNGSKSIFKSTVKGLLMMAFKQKSANLQTVYFQDLTDHKMVGELELPQDETCTTLKLNHQGNKLALGFFSGSIHLYNVNQPSNILLQKTCKLHSSPITDILWSQDSRFLKSISKDNLIYLDNIKQKDNFLAVYTAKPLHEVQWLNCGKFDWKSFHLWNNRLHTVDQISDIIESYDYLFVCMQNGGLEVFRNPASKEYQELGRFFNSSYQCRVINDEGDKISVVLVSNGILFDLIITEDPQSESEVQQTSQKNDQ